MRIISNSGGLVTGYYELNPFPGCSVIAVSNHAFIYPTLRGKGYGARQHEERLAYARNLGYKLLLATVRIDNDAENYILKKYNWQPGPAFTNRETGHDVRLWSKTL